MTEQAENRRNFHRIFFEAPVTIKTADNLFQGQLADISLNGALIRKPPKWNPQSDDQAELHLKLGSDDVVIRMQAVVTHIEDQQVGLKIQHIDMDSISHLRRLVELNLGDSEMLHRDLEHLVDPDT